MEWRIIQTSQHQTVEFAVDELIRYLRLMDSQAMVDRIVQEETAETEGVRVCIAPEKFPLLHDATLDDAIAISVTENRCGEIAGSNPRAVLIAVYRFLTELGCRFLRPGPDGEYIPSLQANALPVHVCETSSYRHRGICIEGTNAYQNIADLIEWMPKVGLNAYFTQFRSPYGFMQKWYAHEQNSLRSPQPFTPEDAQGMQKAYTAALMRRSMMIHNVGHGWTCEPFDVHLESWKRGETRLNENYSSRLALLQGKRQMFSWTPETAWPCDSNLCYSQQDTRDIITDAITHYCQQHPETDYLHFWLADGMENHCECDQCAEKRPSDWYVTMLNELDQKLTAKHLTNKIVFLIYVDLLWAPEQIKLEHPERFVLMFAPITRQFHRSFALKNASDDNVTIAPYVRNHLDYPITLEQNAAMLRQWQRDFSGDSFDYDYHGVGAHHCDPGEMEISKIMWEDMNALQNLRLNGMMSCQEQRIFFPSGLLMQVMAQTLWNREKPFSQICEEHFLNCYGSEGTLVENYLSQISEAFELSFVRKEIKRISRQAKCAQLERVAPIVNEFLPVIERNVQREKNSCRCKSWEILRYHALLVKGEAEILILALNGEKDQAEKCANRLCDQLDADEPSLQTVLDIARLKGKVQQMVNITDKMEIRP